LQLNAVGLKGKKQVEIVRGIGPAYARRLHEAGIHDLTHLAAQTAARVGEIVGLKTWQRADPQAWIDEARELAAAFSDGETD
ncbi:MAG: helix-hairpin-helix domain-containing protein, partial [Chloroflexi bacterium]|nr:helix-hairpin-helix domain-containing protein [Chloroflexota bacterium]